MHYQLRDYQLNGIDGISQAFASGFKKVLFRLDTGGGKTLCFCHMTLKAIQKGKTVLILVNRKTLLEQAKEKLHEYGVFPQLIIPGVKFKENKVYLASVDTLARRKYDLKPDLIIIDEAHIKVFDKILPLYPDAYVLGVTATPLRQGTKSPMSEVYQTIIQPINIKDLIEQGFLVDEMPIGPIEEHDYKMKGEDFDDKEMFMAFDKKHRYDGVVKYYQKFAEGEKAICFCINVAHSKKTAEAFNLAGVPAKHIDGTMDSKIVKFILSEHKAGKFRVLVNCNMATFGYDDPSITTVILDRATTSLPLLMQMVGRGARPYPGKSHFKVIDHGGNFLRLGFWSQEREWTLEPPKKKKKREGVAAIKNCPEDKVDKNKKAGCGALISASATSCKFCGFEFDKKEVKLVEAEFGILDKKQVIVPDHLKKPWTRMTIEELIELQELKGYKLGWLIHQVKDQGEAGLRKIAEIKKYKKGWVERQKKFL